MKKIFLKFIPKFDTVVVRVTIYWVQRCCAIKCDSFASIKVFANDPLSVRLPYIRRKWSAFHGSFLTVQMAYFADAVDCLPAEAVSWKVLRWVGAPDHSFEEENQMGLVKD